MNPLVSAVIPTHNRLELVQRAVRSALSQTYSNLEVLVVVDGFDPATVAVLESIQESRLRIIALEKNVRGGEARNIGVRQAKGEWVAFLDDDDEWLPEKIAKQIALLAHVDPGTNFIACQYEAWGVDYKKIMPHRFPDTGENWSEYIYCQHLDLLPSTYLVKRELMLVVPFTKGLYSNEDADWILHAYVANAITAEWLAEALTIYHCESSIVRTSTRSNWESPYQWALNNREALLTEKAFSYCLLWLCLPHIKHGKKPVRNTLFLLYKAITKGKIDLQFCVLFIVFSLLVAGTRHKLRAICRRAWKRSLVTSGKDRI
jgi:glycosyltransferase involved in cell wall biosynthesis